MTMSDDNLQILTSYAILAADADDLERRLIALLLLVWRIQGKRKKIVTLE